MNEQKYGRILVVEDDPDAAVLAQYTLQQEGYDVVVANDGTTGLDIAFSDQRVDLIVLDIMLPDIDGFEVCSQLKNHRKTKQTPVIMLTAKNTDEDMIRGMDIAYADAYLNKPTEPWLLCEVVYGLLNHRFRSQPQADAVPSTSQS